MIFLSLFKKKHWQVLFLFFLTLCCLLLIKAFCFSLFYIPSQSMYPSLKEGDIVLTLKRPLLSLLRFDQSLVHRGDIVIFKKKGDENFYVKRILGMGGESISFIEKVFYVNDQAVTKSRFIEQREMGGEFNEKVEIVYEQLSNGMAHRVAYAQDVLFEKDFSTIKLAEDEYFVLGDFRDRSIDSRYFGPIKGNYVVGKVLFVVGNVKFLDKKKAP